MKITRRYTKEGQSPYTGIEFDLRTSEIKNPDGSVTVRFDPNGSGDKPNTIATPEGWNFLVRLYRPRAAIIDGTWQLPELTPATD